MYLCYREQQCEGGLDLKALNIRIMPFPHLQTQRYARQIEIFTQSVLQITNI